MHKQLAETFVKTLEQRVLQQKYLIEKTKIQYIRMSRILSGNHEIRIDEAFKIATALELDFCEVVRKAINKSNRTPKKPRKTNDPGTTN